MARLRLGVSSCLLGETVRYDGGHKLRAVLPEIFAEEMDFVPTCPEIEIGLGVPREPIRLEGEEPRLVAAASRTDHTRAMTAWGRRRTRELRSLGIAGYVLKERSPSCGPRRVEVVGAGGTVRRNGVGLFAAALGAAFPHLPVIGDEAIKTPPGQIALVVRAFAYRRWRHFAGGRFLPNRLKSFHEEETRLLQSANPEQAESLARWMARLPEGTAGQVCGAFAERFFGILDSPAAAEGWKRLLTRRPEAFREEGERRLLLRILNLR